MKVGRTRVRPAYRQAGATTDARPNGTMKK